MINPDMNLQTLKDQFSPYISGWESGKGYYIQEVQLKIDAAKKYVDKPVVRKNPIACFDDDETLISNLPIMIANDWGWPNLALKFSWQNEMMPSLQPTQQFYNYLLSINYGIYIITARSNIYFTQTMAELKNGGYEGYAQLIMKDPNDQRSDAQYKTETRAALVAQGYDIIVNIGDHDSDLQGNADYQCKLPNYFY